jgi:hypothetical protein
MDKLIQEAESMAGGQVNQAQAGAGQAAAAGGSSLLGGLEQAGEDSAINTGINSLLTKEVSGSGILNHKDF